MIELIKCFDWSKHEVISVIGSGGKSNLIAYLANCFPDEKILISTTTKVLLPEKEKYHILWLNPYCQDEKMMKGTNPADVMIAGDEFLMDGIEKLQMSKKVEFIQSFKQFDKVFLEADGSRGLPLKGWAEFEPVVLPETTMTIGVIPLSAIGKPATNNYIHRLSLWLKLIEEEECILVSSENRHTERMVMAEGVKESLISKENMIQLITHKKGLWKEAKGEKVLYISQVESQQQLKLAKELVEDLPEDFKKKTGKIIAGSAKEGKGYILHCCRR